jgi:triphosphoribosyl-dephospho-CoA synthase
MPSSRKARSGCSRLRELERLSAALAEGLWLELYLTPKPGLVDLEDTGSHPDLSLGLMESSIALLGDYHAELCASLFRGEPVERQVAIAQGAERRMLGRLGSNTHKGAIFLGGVLLMARDRAGTGDEGAVRLAAESVARDLLGRIAPRSTHGEAARARFGVGGILREVATGLPSVFECALPTYRAAAREGADHARASFAALARLMQTVEDTTALYRCGPPGLAQLREDGACLEALVRRGDHLAYLRERNAAYARTGLTMGGVADLLGVAFGWLVATGEVSPAVREG